LIRKVLHIVRWLPLSVVCAAIGLRAPQVWTDWEIAQSAGQQILSGDALTVYVDHPAAQMGPLALVFSGALPHAAYILLVSLLLAPFLALCERVAAAHASPRDASLCVTAGGALLIYPWSDFASQGHLDDVLVLFGCGGLLLAGLDRRSGLAAAAFTLAVAAKPTAVLALPVLFAVGPTAVLLAGLATATIWLPFFLADPGGFLTAGRGVIEVRPGSFPDLLGYEIAGPTPPWFRVVALVGGAVLCAIFARRNDPARGLLAAFAIRAVVDPNPAQCYASTIAALGLLADVPYRRLPITCLAGLTGWLISEPVIRAPELGLPRIVVTSLTPLFAPRVRRLNPPRPNTRSGDQASWTTGRRSALSEERASRGPERRLLARKN
jgi:hypothetical protein